LRRCTLIKPAHRRRLTLKRWRVSGESESWPWRGAWHLKRHNGGLGIQDQALPRARYSCVQECLSRKRTNLNGGSLRHWRNTIETDITVFNSGADPKVVSASGTKGGNKDPKHRRILRKRAKEYQEAYRLADYLRADKDSPAAPSRSGNDSCHGA
jgi:hypothetical protein